MHGGDIRDNLSTILITYTLLDIIKNVTSEANFVIVTVPHESTENEVGTML